MVIVNNLDNNPPEKEFGVRVTKNTDDATSTVTFDGILGLAFTISDWHKVKPESLKNFFRHIFKRMVDNKFYLLCPLDPNDTKVYIFAESLFYVDVWIVIAMSPKGPIFYEFTTEECQKLYTSHIPGYDDMVPIETIGVDSKAIWVRYLRTLPIDFFDIIIDTIKRSAIIK